MLFTCSLLKIFHTLGYASDATAQSIRSGDIGRISLYFYLKLSKFVDSLLEAQRWYCISYKYET